MTTTGKTSADVEREVEATRGQIDQTVEALKEKMQPRELFDEATRIMGTTSNKLLTTVVDQAKANPIPVALIGAGIAWLALSQRKSGEGYDGFSGEGYYETYEGYDESGGLGRRLKTKAAGAIESAKGKLAGAKSAAAGAIDKAKDGIAQAKTGAAEGADQAKGRVAALASTAQLKAGEAGRVVQTKFNDTLQTEPLILAALGLAVGAAIGAALPATPVERRYIGPTRDKLVGRGKELAETSLEEAKEVAQRAYGQVKEELHRQTGPEGEGSTLTDKAKALAQAGVETVRDEAESRLAH